jgi:hypothetical protein
VLDRALRGEHLHLVGFGAGNEELAARAERRGRVEAVANARPARQDKTTHAIAACGDCLRWPKLEAVARLILLIMLISAERLAPAESFRRYAGDLRHHAFIWGQFIHRHLRW